MRTALQMFNDARRKIAETQSAQAKAMGITRSYMNDLVNGRRRLTAKVLTYVPNGYAILAKQSREELAEEWKNATS